MTERRTRSLVVIDEDGRAIGVVTGNDLLSLYQRGEDQQRGEDLGSVADLMSPPITCGPDLPLRDAAELMISKEVHRLVVVDPSRSDDVPIGILSTSDIVAEMASERSIWQQGRI